MHTNVFWSWLLQIGSYKIRATYVLRLPIFRKGMTLSLEGACWYLEVIWYYILDKCKTVILLILFRIFCEQRVWFIGENNARANQDGYFGAITFLSSICVKLNNKILFFGATGFRALFSLQITFMNYKSTYTTHNFAPIPNPDLKGSYLSAILRYSQTMWFCFWRRETFFWIL